MVLENFGTGDQISQSATFNFNQGSPTSLNFPHINFVLQNYRLQRWKID